MWRFAEIRTVPDIIRHWSSTTPDKAALIQGPRQVTYAELDQRSTRIANALLAEGVGPGSHIGFLGKNAAEFYDVWFGATKAGSAIAPFNSPERRFQRRAQERVMEGVVRELDALRPASRPRRVGKQRGLGADQRDSWIGRRVGRHPLVEVIASAVGGERHDRERLTAGTPATEDELRAHCRTLIAGYKVPKVIHIEQALPMTASGKIQKAVLRGRHPADIGTVAG